MRVPWTRNSENFIRRWLVLGPFPGSGLKTDFLLDRGGEAAVQPTEGLEQKLPDGTTRKWQLKTCWNDFLNLPESFGDPKDDAVAYAFAKINRTNAGKALFSLGTDEGICVWVNGKLVFEREELRSATPDEDQLELDMNAGENTLLIKVSQHSGPWGFYARVLEPGTVLARKVEIGPWLAKMAATSLTVKTDIGRERADVEAVKVEVVAPGGKVVFSRSASRGAVIDIDAACWADGPYEVRCTTHTLVGHLYVTHLPWYKGNALAKARDLAAVAAKADSSKPEGSTLKMLAEMVDDRLGVKVADAKGNPWSKIHSPLMEFDEMMLEAKGQTGRIRPHGFVRLAYRDQVDGSPQFCRVYLPPGYDPTRKWPLVVQLHGYNSANPVYVRWWAVDSRHPAIDAEFSNHQGVIYMEAHGRGNTEYKGIGDSDVVRVIAMARQMFSVDEDRVYLTGESMGGWGTWSVGTRHPDLFAAIAPVYGGADYHSRMFEEELASLSEIDRFRQEKWSSWAMADGLLNVPISIHHGDQDDTVSVEYSRWGTRLLQRWGYDVRYHEIPGAGHEFLDVMNENIEWFLKHRRNPNPRHVRIRSAELRYASAYWARINQAISPLAFMVLDAEIIGPNTLRLDTQNISDVTLAPSKVLVDPDKPLTIVWNGVTHRIEPRQGQVRLSAEGYSPAPLHKSAVLPGTMSDVTLTPFAIVIGTISRDPEMVEVCRQKAEKVIQSWRNDQKQAPRVFKDTEISDADMARYSLILFGGPEANAVTAKLADRLPLKIEAESVTIDGKVFEARDAAVQMVYPDPLNAERYVLVLAATSAEGMRFCEPGDVEITDWDFVVTDGRLPSSDQRGSASDLRIVSGMFDSNWRRSDQLTIVGNSKARASACSVRIPKEDLRVDRKAFATYVGRYQMEHGPVLVVTLDGARLIIAAEGEDGRFELIPESLSDFFLREHDFRLAFVKDASGKTTGMAGTQVVNSHGIKSVRAFTAKKIE